MATNIDDSQEGVSTTALATGPGRIEGTNLGTFVQSRLPRPQCRILEIGGPPYAAAQWLLDRGHEIEVVDPTGSSWAEESPSNIVPEVVTPGAVRLKRRAYDATIASNVLHLFHDLEDMFGPIANSVVSGGMFVLEEPDVDELSAGATAWYRLALHELRDRGYIKLSTDDDLERAVFAERTIAEYFEQRGYALHRRLPLRGAIRAKFKIVSESDCPYLYRYFARVAPSGEAGDRLTEGFFQLESDAIQRGLLAPLGRRFVLAND